MNEFADVPARQDLTATELHSLAASLADRAAYLPIKRLIDIVASGMLLIVLGPSMLCIGLLVRMSSPGPALYRTPRYGRGGKRFMMLKFRSMLIAPPDADAAFRRRVSGSGLLTKSGTDPRITKLGRWMRRTSIDELPQLLNVFKGDMSLIGPRPVMPEMLDPFPTFKDARTLVRPGLGGLWQVRERANATHVSFMWGHDLEYVQNISLSLDLRMIMQTAVVTLRRTGAA